MNKNLISASLSLIAVVLLFDLGIKQLIGLLALILSYHFNFHVKDSSSE